MYRVLKAKGYGANVIVENMETKANIIIGTVSTEIVNIIKEGGFTLPEYYEEWNVEINKEVATALTHLTMKMKKPIRDQSIKAKSEQNVRTHDGEIDAFDLIFGNV